MHCNNLHRSYELILPLAAGAALLGLVTMVPAHVWQGLRPGATAADDDLKCPVEPPINSLNLAPDGTWVAGKKGTGIVLLNPASGVVVERCSFPEKDVTTVAWGSDGSLVAGYGDGTVAVWRPSPTAEGLWKSAVVGIVDMPDGGVTGCASADKLVAATDYLGGLTVWESSTGSMLWRQTVGNHSLFVPTFAPDGRTLLAGCANGTIRAWNSRKGALLAEFPGHHGPVISVAVAPDGRRFASGGLDGTVRLWNLSQSSPVWIQKVDPTFITRLTFSPDSRSIVAGGIPLVWVLDTERGEVTAMLDGHERPICDVAFLPDGRTLFTASCDGRAIFWDFETGLERRRL